jgi:hypothetical protein
MNKLIGKVSLVKPIIDKLQVNEIFDEILQGSPKREKVSNGLASEIMVMNRLAAPMPMYDVEGWVDEETCIGEVYDVESRSQRYAMSWRNEAAASRLPSGVNASASTSDFGSAPSGHSQR